MVDLTSGNDIFNESASNNVITVNGLEGNDTITGGTNNDIITGGDDSDSIDGGAGNDSIFGGAGFVAPTDAADTLNGNAGNDTILGNGGNDLINGGDDNDSLHGGADNDVVNGGNGADIAFGSTGQDTVTGGEGNDTLYGGDSAGHPGDGNDLLNGGGGDDLMFGNGGNDILQGAGGNDTMYGGFGSDTFDGGAGNDVMFIYDSGAGNSATVQNFDNGDIVSVITEQDIDFSPSLLVQDGNNAVLTLDSGFRIILEGVNGNDVSRANFSFGSTNEESAANQLNPVTTGNTLPGGNDGGSTFTPNNAIAPNAKDDFVDAPNNQQINLDVLTNDHDDNGDPFEIISFTNPNNGVAQLIGGQLFYTANKDYIGEDFIEYRIQDDGGSTDTAAVFINVIKGNGAPVAVADAATTNEDNAVTIDVLDNDTDPDNDAITIDSFTQATNGTVTEVAGELVYTPNKDFNGKDSFTYTIEDPDGEQSTATVNVTVNPVNDAPVAVDDDVSTDEDTPLVIDALANDYDVDGDTVIANFFGAASNGTVTYSNGLFTYTPDANFNGSDSFFYGVKDNKGGFSVAATVNITVNPTNDDPIANADSVTTKEGEAITIDVLGNDTDVDGDTLSIESFSQPKNGSVTEVNGELVYTPFEFRGNDSFTYTVSDGNGGFDTATVDVKVNGGNLKIFGSDEGSNSSNSSLTITNDDRIEYSTSGRFTTVLPENGDYTNRAGDATINIATANGTATIANLGAWNSVKTGSVQGRSEELEGNALQLNNFVHGDVRLNGPEDVTVGIDGAKRGNVTTDSGNDTVTVGVTTNNVNGSGMDFTLNTKSGNDTVTFQGAADKGWNNNVTTGEGAKVNAKLGSGDDTYDARNTEIASTVNGGSGNDTVYGGEGDDSLSGGNNDDKLSGGKGNDTLIGSNGADFLIGGDGQDSLDGGGSNDELLGNKGNDTLIGAGGEDTLFGGKDDDILDGGNQNDQVNGDKGNDLLNGGGGADILNGGSENDTLNGDNGNDTLSGGNGTDVFHFNGGFGRDVITDFELGTDLMRFENLDIADMQITFDGTDSLVRFAGNRTISVEGVDLTSTFDQTVFSQGFETDTAGWFDSNSTWDGLVTRVASGHNGITSEDGSFHAVYEQSGSSPTGPFTRFDGYRDTFPSNGYKASADIYLDPDALAAGEGFDYSVASNGTDGLHQRDFIFHITKDTSTGDLLVGGSNNTNFDPKENLESGNHYDVDNAGWYTFEHHFRDAGDGTLAVDLNLYDDAGTLLFTETRNNTTLDLIPAEVGGNRYGWFTNIDINGGIAVDNTELTLLGDTSWYQFV